jgi:hypothetical protein
MNKIERAIYDVKSHIKYKEKQLLIAETELNSLRDHLHTLEIIQADKSIPHQIDNLVEFP